jgi:hypothetical protein
MTSAVPFLIRRMHSAIRGPEITATREEFHGLLRLAGGQLVFQWSTAREVSRAGREILVARDLGPVQEVSLPVTGLAGAQVRWRLLPWPPRWQLVLRAADLQAFRALAGEAALLLEHPAELVLDLRRSDRAIAREFAAELDFALAEASLQAAEGQVELPSAERDDALSRLPRSTDRGTGVE